MTVGCLSKYSMVLVLGKVRHPSHLRQWTWKISLGSESLFKSKPLELIWLESVLNEVKWAKGIKDHVIIALDSKIRSKTQVSWIGSSNLNLSAELVAQVLSPSSLKLLTFQTKDYKVVRIKSYFLQDWDNLTFNKKSSLQSQAGQAWWFPTKTMGLSLIFRKLTDLECD